jgi:hypothetical protein
MKKLLLLLVVLPAFANAEIYYVTIPGEGWSLKLDVPAVRSIQGKSAGRLFQYLGGTVGGLTFSIHTEIEGAASNEACRDHWWSKAARAPNIVKDSVKLGQHERAVYATHLTEGNIEGKAYKTANGHAYFVKNGLCVDLHVSHYPYNDSSPAQVETALRSLAISQ